MFVARYDGTDTSGHTIISAFSSNDFNNAFDELTFKNSALSIKTIFKSLVYFCSEKTSEQVDQEIRKILDETYKQAEALNKSQESFSKILAGVKKYGTLAEFSLASILKDLLPHSQ